MEFHTSPLICSNYRWWWRMTAKCKSIFYNKIKNKYKLINRGNGTVNVVNTISSFHLSNVSDWWLLAFVSSNKCATSSAQFRASSSENVIPTRILRLITREASSFVTFCTVVFSKEKRILSDTGSFDWNGWNSITTEFRVILSEHCRVYVPSNEKGITFFSFSHLSKMMWGIKWCNYIILIIINLLMPTISRRLVDIRSKLIIERSYFHI